MKWMSGRTRGWVLFGVSSVLVAGMMTFAAQRFLSSSRRIAALFIPEERLSFGNVWERPGFEWNLPIRNRTSKAVTVTHALASCGCVSVSPEAFTVPPNSQIDLRVTLDLRRRSNLRDEKELHRPFDVRIGVVVADEPRKNREWILTGHVWRCPLEMVPADVVFGESLVTGCVFPEACVAVRPITGCKVVQARCVPPIALATLEQCADHREGYRLTIQPERALETGDHECCVHLICELPSTGVPVGELGAPEFILPVKMKVIPTAYVAPEVVVLGVQELGETVEYSVVAGVLDGNVFNVSCEHESPSFGTEVRRECDDEVSREPKPFRIIQHIDRIGEVVARLQFVFDIQGEPSQVVDVSVSYLGIRGGS